jgi:hypothetical protein
VAAAILLAVLAVPSPARSEPLSGHGPSPSVVTLESLILPGLGQASNGKWLKGAGFFAAYGGFITWGILKNQDLQDAQGRLNAAAEADRPGLTQEVNGLRDGRNAKYWFAGLTLLLSMVDAYVDAHLRGFDQRIDAKVGLVPGDSGPEWAIRLTVPVGGTGGSGS